MSKCQPYGMCPRCFQMKTLTRHHIYPRRFFGSKSNRASIMLCRTCHNELELIIPIHEQKEKHWYVKILANWLKGDYDGQNMRQVFECNGV